MQFAWCKSTVRLPKHRHALAKPIASLGNVWAPRFSLLHLRQPTGIMPFTFALFSCANNGLYWLSASWGRNRLPTGRFVRQAEPELVYPEGNAPKLTRPSGSGDLALILPGHRDSGFALNLHRVRRLASTPKAPFLALRRGMGLFPSGKRAAPRLCPRRMDPWGAKSALRLASRWTEAPAH